LVLGRVILSLPFNLPDWISMFVGSHSGLIDWLVSLLVTDIENHDCSIIASSGNQGWLVWMEVNAHDSSLGGETVLWVEWVLNSETADKT